MFGGSAVAIAADVRDPGGVAEAFVRAEKVLGAIDAVFNNAGTSIVTSLLETIDEQWLHQLNTNLSGSCYVSRQAA